MKFNISFKFYCSLYSRVCHYHSTNSFQTNLWRFSKVVLPFLQRCLLIIFLRKTCVIPFQITGYKYNRLFLYDNAVERVRTRFVKAKNKSYLKVYLQSFGRAQCTQRGASLIKLLSSHFCSSPAQFAPASSIKTSRAPSSSYCIHTRSPKKKREPCIFLEQ